MAGALRGTIVVLVLGLPALGSRVPGNRLEASMVQTWDTELDGGGASTKASDTPVTRVVRLLKEMQGAMKKEMDEDEDLHGSLMCWCKDNKWTKGEDIANMESKITQLESEIERLKAEIAELTVLTAQLTGRVKDMQGTLVMMASQRDQEKTYYGNTESDLTAYIENLRAAIVVLSKHHGGAGLLDVGRGAANGASRSSHQAGRPSMLQASQRFHRDFPWGPNHETGDEVSLDNFMVDHHMTEHDSPPASATDGDVQKFLVAETQSMHDKFLQQPDGDSTEQPATLPSALDPSADAAAAIRAQKFLQRADLGDESAPPGLPSSEASSFVDPVVRHALKSVSAFMQAKHLTGYVPGYNAQSGEILGVLKQMVEQMQDDLTQEQKTEAEKAKAFVELRTAKMAELTAAMSQLDAKEDALATSQIDLANAEEELDRLQKLLSEYQVYMKELLKTCDEAEADFQLRKKARMEEIHAVSQTIGILMEDDARDSFSSTYGGASASLLQVSSAQSKARHWAAVLLLSQAKRSRNPELAALATAVELSAFGKVKKAIDGMVATLKKQQADEVKQQDWCVEELHQTDMSKAKTEDIKAHLTAQLAELASTLKRLLGEIKEAQLQISEAEGMVQRASVDRQKANLDFQRTVADQRASQEALGKALQKLSSYYDGTEGSTVALQTPRGQPANEQKESDDPAPLDAFLAGVKPAEVPPLKDPLAFAQLAYRRDPETSSYSSSSSSSSSESWSSISSSEAAVEVAADASPSGTAVLTGPATPVGGPGSAAPPVRVMEFKPSGGANGVMALIEKLIYDAKDLEADAVKSEAEAQAQYEATVKDTNDSVDALQRVMVTKKREIVQTKKDETQAEEDLTEAVDELERLYKYDADIHDSCDYYTKNFETRQASRAQEIEALQQAKQILSGAELS